MYFVTDGILGLALVLLLWKIDGSTGFKQKEEKNEENIAKAIKKLFSIPMVFFLLGLMITGICIGINGTYLYLYLQNDLDASSELLSYITIVTLLGTTLFMPLADKVVKWVGPINVIVANILIECSKLVVFAKVQTSPPNFALGLSALNFNLWSFGWVAIINYAYSLAPPHLMGTMTAVVNVFMLVLCMQQLTTYRVAR